MTPAELAFLSYVGAAILLHSTTIILAFTLPRRIARGIASGKFDVPVQDMLGRVADRTILAGARALWARLAPHPTACVVCGEPVGCAGPCAADTHSHVECRSRP